MGQPWSRVLSTTIKDFVTGYENNILRNRKVFALMKKRGRITYNHSGTSVDWKVQYKRVKPTPFADGDTIEFSRKDRYKKAELDWRGYSMSDSVSKGEFLMNRGKEAIIKIFSGIAENMMSDIEDSFGEEIYVNGYAAANSKRMHGIESFLGATAQTNFGVGIPTGSFAGLSCVPGAYGGTWNNSSFTLGANTTVTTPFGWPHGRGDAQFDFWSPIVVDYGDPMFPGGANPNNTWANNCVEAVSMLLIKGKKSKSTKGMLDIIVTDDEMYRIYLAKQRTLQRIQVERGQNASDLVALGFTDVMNQDGCDITWEYGMTSNVGYALNLDNVEMKSMQSQLFVPEGPEQDMSTKAWRFSIDFWGNLFWNPKFQGALKHITA